ncbi:hypothetical protein K439DRAFT_1649384 [Ramaria rubella]|nr:hypothetical protein K439DRAFT_1649384 [Ramaria rubella]
MPRQTDCQAVIDSLLDAFIAELLAEGDAQIQSYINMDSDDSETSDSKADLEDTLPPLSESYLQTIDILYSTRYLNERVPIPKTGRHLWYTLHIYKHSHPKIFRTYLRIWPTTFDSLVEKIKDDPVFHNNSDNKQIPVGLQLAVALYCFGHFGNAASLQKVGLWAGWGYRTVDLCTKRIMTAVCHEPFRRIVMQWPNEEVKENAKAWVEKQSCPRWRDRWCMVDGTLVPLFARPGFFGNSWYDRKSNYSLNVQHDAMAWKETRIPQEHNHLLEQGEWVWGDTVYPLQTWCQAPYQKPKKDIRENVRVRLEHCVGFLKGCWSSLRGLRLHIDKPAHIQLACLWLTACITLHCFTMQHEDGHDLSTDDFYREGLVLVQDEGMQWITRLVDAKAHVTLTDRQREAEHDVELLQGWLKRETLKKDLLSYLG